MLLDHVLQAGPVAIVLLVLSVFALAFVLDKVWTHLRYPFYFKSRYSRIKKLILDRRYCEAEDYLASHPRGWKAAIRVIIGGRKLNNEQRQNLAVHWLEGERHYLNGRLKLLGLIGAIAPLLGLLGTVFGIIEMFKAIAHSSGPVTPALLAEGMWTAMITTALGLVIAIPALAASHGLEQLSQHRLQRIQDILNELNLILIDDYTGPALQSDERQILQAAEAA